MRKKDFVLLFHNPNTAKKTAGFITRLLIDTCVDILEQEQVKEKSLEADREQATLFGSESGR